MAKTKAKIKDDRALVLEIYRLVGPWTHSRTDIRDSKEACLDWVREVDAALGDQRTHFRDVNSEGIIIWCDDVVFAHETPAFNMTEEVAKVTCLACLKNFRERLCTEADEAMSESFVVAARESEVRSIEAGTAPSSEAPKPKRKRKK